MVYLDNAATTLIKPDAVARSMASAVKTLASPGRGGHEASMRAAQTAFDCRETAAEMFGVCSPENVIFTMNATHALNIAIRSLAGRGSRAVVSGYEHNSVMRPLHAVGADIRVARGGLFDKNAVVYSFRKELMRGADVAVCTHISNVFGFILPIDEVAEMCRKYSVPLIIDAAQSAGAETLNIEDLGASFAAMPGHKGLYGPQGTGLLLIGENVRAQPLMFGGSGSNSELMDMPDVYPDRLEAGTHNMPGIAGLSEGIRFVRKIGEYRIKRHERRLIDLAHRLLSGIGGLELYYTEDAGAQGGVMSFAVADMSSEECAESLSELGIAVRAGLHCAPSAHASAGTDKRGTVRISVSAFNTEDDIYALFDAMKRIKAKKL
ncbi:MAG: aminotransferase class V-fold PLP-dependent enzyme [Oscillospiraceae bacterium]|nr:aminotransferase class V-fold PLP-dependent enzyme [Oscillospiraceae bacterium]